MRKSFHFDKKIFRYDHPLVKLIASIAVAMLIVYPDKDEKWSDVLLVPSYFKLMLASMLVAYLVFTWIFMVSAMLAVNFGQKSRLRQRWSWQLIMGVILSFLFSYLCSEFYFSSLGVDVQNHYGRNTLPLFTLIILCANLIYCYYIDGYTDLGKDLDRDMEFLTVQSGNTTSRIPASHLAYAYHYNNVNWLRIFGRELKDKIYVDDTLDNIWERLDPNTFAKLNRQFVVNRNAIRAVNRKNRRLTFTLDPPCEIDEIRTNREKRRELEAWLGSD